MAALTFFSQSRPISTPNSFVPLPIALADMTTPLTAAGQTITPAVQDTVNAIVNQQVVMGAMSTADPDYQSRLRVIQTQLRGLGLYPAGFSTGPNPAWGF